MFSFSRVKAKRLLVIVSTGLTICDNILPVLLNGSSIFIKNVLPARNAITTIPKIEYRVQKYSFECKNFFLFLFFFVKWITTSCNVPSGQIVEQYTLPNKMVRIKMIMNPATKGAADDKNFINDGRN